MRVQIGIALGFLAVCGLWLLWGTVGVEYFARWRHGSYGPLSIEDLGQTGDIFGGVSALFAALAFLGVGIGAYLQFKTHQITERQHVQQAFEPLFFQLLQLHRTTASELRLVTPNGWLAKSGTAISLDEAIRGLREINAEQWPTILRADTSEHRRELLCWAFNDLYAANESQLGPYFRSLYHVFALIDRSRLADADKAQYANIARSFLGTETLFLVTINCLTERGAGLTRLVNTYGLLKHARMTDGNGPSADSFVIGWFFEPGSTRSYEERTDVARSSLRQ